MRLAGWAALGALTLAGAAFGQAAPGRSGMSTEDNLTNVQAYRDLQNFGICFVRTRRPEALALIAVVPGSPEERRIVDRMLHGDQGCLFGGTRMQLSTIFIRGSIAEGLYRSAGVPEEYRLAAPAAADVRTLYDVGRCYAAGHRSEVQALLETPPGSREEVAAVAAIWNDFRTCMPGFRVRLNAPWIRFLLAEALLRLAPPGS